jgi:hypothetical protein
MSLVELSFNGIFHEKTERTGGGGDDDEEFYFAFEKKL